MFCLTIMLTLVVRSRYDGKSDNRRGTLVPENRSRSIPPSLRTHLRFFVQVSNRTDGIFQGCCNLDRYKRLAFMEERHFMDFHRGQWDFFRKATPLLA